MNNFILKLLIIFICCFQLTFKAQSDALAQSRMIWQPVQEYFIRQNPEKTSTLITGTRRLNSFLSYTHIGSDFGFHGPAQDKIIWEGDEITAHLNDEPTEWAGLWHSLAGLSRETDQTLNFEKIWPEPIAEQYQPKIRSLMIHVRGKGNIKMEIKSVTGVSLWSQVVQVDSEHLRTYIQPILAQSIPHAKWLNWTAEPKAEISISDLNLGILQPEVPFDKYTIAACYAKLLRCLDSQNFLIKDRAHLEKGAFESIPTTGIFGLATALMTDPQLQIVTPEYAKLILEKIHFQVSKLRSTHGILPHFVSQFGDQYLTHPNTEYSTVDTAIYYHAMLLGCEILQHHELLEKIKKDIQSINISKCLLPNQTLSHGFKEDGTTLIPHGWDDWGGETALINLLWRMIDPNAPCKPAVHPGQIWQGTGFIAELHSLFYPQFDLTQLDALDHINWRETRQKLREKHQSYLSLHWPNEPTTQIGLYGFSAGENAYGDAYLVSGNQLPNQKILHPHYFLMSSPLHPNPEAIYTTLRHCEQMGWFPPWGLVENIHVDGKSYLPMEGSLNAAFEAVSAYRLYHSYHQTQSLIQRHAPQNELMKKAIELYYPKQSL